MGIRATNQRDEEIDNFCTDLKVLWKKYVPNLHFGWMVYFFINRKPESYFSTEAEFLDLFREWLEERSSRE